MSDHPVPASAGGPGRGGLGRPPDPAEVDAEYARDTWQASRLGIQAPRGRASITFAGLSQPWLRQAVKAWCQWRLATGCAWGTANACAGTPQPVLGVPGCQ